MEKAEIEEKIRKKLDSTLRCEFKKAWLPEGWTVVRIDKFVKELTEELTKED